MIDCVDRQELVTAFWQHYELDGSASRSLRKESDQWFWAWEEVTSIAKSVPVDAVELFVALADAAPDDQARCYLGTGPLEDLVLHHGPHFVDQIDEAARQHEHFRTALRCVWYGSRMDQGVAERLRRFGPPL
jgi:hypothetical protein